jgi:predicted enzyme related to lactoylglutathione lyase
MSKQVLKSAYGTMYYVTDMEKSVQYYKQSFGLQPRFESADWTEFEVNGHALCLHSMSHEHTKPQNGVLISNVQDIRAVVTQLKSQGVEFLTEVESVHPGAFSVEFKDPSGNVLSLYEDTNKR